MNDALLELINQLKKNREIGYSMNHSLIDIEYALFPPELPFDDNLEMEIAECIYNFLEEKHLI